MKDWIIKLDAFLQFNETAVLNIREKFHTKWHWLLQKLNLNNIELHKTNYLKVILTKQLRN